MSFLWLLIFLRFQSTSWSFEECHFHLDKNISTVAQSKILKKLSTGKYSVYAGELDEAYQIGATTLQYGLYRKASLEKRRKELGAQFENLNELDFPYSQANDLNKAEKRKLLNIEISDYYHTIEDDDWIFIIDSEGHLVTDFEVHLASVQFKSNSHFAIERHLPDAIDVELWLEVVDKKFKAFLLKANEPVKPQIPSSN